MNNQIKSKTIVFAHGLFLTPKCLNKLLTFFEAKGYTCHAPSNPYHEGTPQEMWSNTPKELEKVNFEDVVQKLGTFIDTLPEKPILIGHSLGGLTVQKLAEMGKAAAAVSRHHLRVFAGRHRQPDFKFRRAGSDRSANSRQ